MADQNVAAQNEGCWLPLIEYSIKSGVSLSTIRRKIKSNSVSYRLEKGKYLIFLPNVETRQQSQVKEATQPQEPKIIPPPFQKKLDRMVGEKQDPEAAVKMVSDAFELALHEKDERILLLEKKVREQEERLNELKLLVQVIEEKYDVHY